MWFPSPNLPDELDRAEGFWLFGVLLGVYAIRWFVCGYLWTNTPLHPWFIAFLGLCLINIQFAPYPSRGVMMLARPVYGLAVFNYLIEQGRYKEIKRVLWFMVIFGGMVGLMALTTTQWTEKSNSLYSMIALLPRLPTGTGALKGGFNPNEIAGALAWLTPLLFGLILLKRYRWAAAIGFGLLLVAAFLGQSRVALSGILLSLCGLIPLVPEGIWRRTAVVGVGALVALEVAIFLNWLPASPAAPTTITRRDERTFAQRFDIWKGSLEIVVAYPLTGVGMNRFRWGPVREDFPVRWFDYPPSPDSRNWDRRILSHTHNELLQITTDLGLLGVVVFVMWYLYTLGMVGYCWLRGDRPVRIVVASAMAGLVAHAIYGLADAVPVWDRLSFIFWMMLAVIAAQFIALKHIGQDGEV